MVHFLICFIKVEHVGSTIANIPSILFSKLICVNQISYIVALFILSCEYVVTETSNLQDTHSSDIYQSNGEMSVFYRECCPLVGEAVSSRGVRLSLVSDVQRLLPLLQRFFKQLHAYRE